MDKEGLLAELSRVIESQYGGVQAAFADSLGLSRAYVGDVIKGRREPGPKILDALNIERVVSYEVKGPK